MRPDWGNHNWVMPGTSAAPVLSALPVTARNKDSAFNLAMAMAELASVAQQRDKALTERDAARAGYSAMNTRIYGPGGECFELDKARAERDKLSEALQRNCVQYVEKQQALIAERDNARQSLRAAEQDVAETEGINADLRTVNARLVADLAAATQRADTAEAILRPKSPPFYIQATGALIGTTTDAQ